MFKSKKIMMSGDSFRDEYCIDFDGTNDLIDATATNHITTGDFTFTAWIKAPDFHDVRILSKWESDNKRWNWCFNTANPPKMHFFNKIGSDYRASYTGTIDMDTLQNQWVHVAFSSIRSGNSTGYINGQYDDADSAHTDTMENSGDMSIASYRTDTTTATYPMKLSEVTIYDKALNQAEIQTIYNGRQPFNHMESSFSSNLKAWYRMGDGLEHANGTTVYDMSSNTNNATMTNMDAGSDYESTGGK
jgi:hypothetical protein|tara:strand:- start:839 stop:1576 length:738 start_codon:yes stop_codon:yes gene_type:complete